MFWIISYLIIGQAAYSSAYSSSQIQRRHSSKLHAEKDGNLLGEQIIELRDGLQSFQENAFESLYDRKISWDNVNNGNSSSSSDEGRKSTFFESLSTEELLQVIESDKYKNFQSVHAEKVTEKVNESSDEQKSPEIQGSNIVADIQAQQSSIETFLSKQAQLTAVSPIAKEEVPIPIMKTESVEKPYEVLKVEDDEISEPPAGGFFGFLNQDKSQETTEESAPPAPVSSVAASPTPVVSSVKPSIPTETKQKGFFDMFSNGPSAAKKAAVSNAPKEQSLPAVKASIPTPIVTKTTPEPSISKTLTPKAEKPPALFNLFNQGKTKVTSPAIPVASKSQNQEEIVTSAIASKIKSKMVSKSDSEKMTSTLDPVPRVTKDSGKVVDEKKDSGFFGFLNDKVVEKVFPLTVKKPIEISVTKPSSSVSKETNSAVQKTPVSSNKTPEGMNKMFQRSAQRLLKEDSSKNKSFQKATDSFRSGVLPAEAFLKTIETLFGVENVESVIVPLIAELPERAAADDLKAAYSKESAAKNKPTQPFKNPFSFNFGSPKKAVEPEAPAATAIIQTPAIKKAPAGARRPAASSKSAAVVFKVPATVPIGKKVLIEKLMKAVIAREIGEKAFFNEASTSLGKTKAIEVMPSIIAVLPNDIGSKVTSLLKSYK